MNPLPAIESRILFIRASRVLLDADLALLYGVTAHGGSFGGLRMAALYAVPFG